MRLDEVNEYGREALRVLIYRYPDRVQRDSCDVNLRTMRVLERDALVQIRQYYDNEDWPPRKTRDSDRTWEAWLTQQGDQRRSDAGVPDAQRAAVHGPYGV